jgi:hypothetical protein
MQQGKLFGGILLRELPVAHPWVPRVLRPSNAGRVA